MKAIGKAAMAAALLLTMAGSAFAQGTGGAGNAAVGGGSGGTTQGATKERPNMGGATSNTDLKSTNSHNAPTHMPQSASHGKGASDTAASGAQ
jgi:hypothetical protein